MVAFQRALALLYANLFQSSKQNLKSSANQIKINQLLVEPKASTKITGWLDFIED